MKVAIVLLGLVALSAAVPQPRGIIYDTAESLANAIMSKATEKLDVLKNAARDFTASLTSSAVSYVSKAESDLASAYFTITTVYDGLVAKGGEVKVCAVSQFSHLTTIKDTVAKNLNYCATDVTRTAGYITEDIGDAITQLNSGISTLYGYVKQCASNLWTSISCTISHINPTITVVENVVSYADETLTRAKALTKQAIVNAEGCTVQTVITAVSQINDLNTSMKSCVAA